MADIARPQAPADPWLVKYAGECMHCGKGLEAGVPAVYDPTAARIHCLTCPSPGRAQVELPPERGVAGAAAQQRYERLVVERQRRIRARWGDRLGGLLLGASSVPQPVQAWKVGADGEAIVGALLDAIPGCWTLHDRRHTGRGGNIDHIVVSAAGVFVVETKHYAGAIRLKVRGSLRRPETRLFVGGRDHSDRIVKALEQADAVRHALVDAAVAPLPSVIPVACFVTNGLQLLAPREYRGVRITRSGSLKRLLTSAPPMAGPDQVDAWLRVLAAAFPPMLGERS
jgi:hypothetical protein